MSKVNLLRVLFNLKGVHYIVTRFGSNRMKQIAYDAKYTIGGWDRFANQKADAYIQLLQSYCKKGNICVIGCGAGGTATHLSPLCYERFLGMDMSEEAIKLAKRQENEKIAFVAADLFTYMPEMCFSVVVFEECINYFRPERGKKAVEKYLGHLDTDGVIIITISQPKRYQPILTLLKSSFRIIEDRNFPGSNRRFLVLGRNC